MAGLGRGNEIHQIHDFPWSELCDDATVIDVGAGTGEDSFLRHSKSLVMNIDNRAGSFCMLLHAHYPGFRLVIQDKAPVIDRAMALWDQGCPSAVSEGKVNFVVHDFFKDNPVHGAELYWLRHIL